MSGSDEGIELVGRQKAFILKQGDDGVPGLRFSARQESVVSASFYTPSSLKCCQAWRCPLNIGGDLHGQRHS